MTKLTIVTLNNAYICGFTSNEVKQRPIDFIRSKLQRYGRVTLNDVVVSGYDNKTEVSIAPESLYFIIVDEDISNVQTSIIDPIPKEAIPVEAKIGDYVISGCAHFGKNINELKFDNFFQSNNHLVALTDVTIGYNNKNKDFPLVLVSTNADYALK